MSRSTYYEELKSLARQKRAEYAVETEAFGLRDLRAIYQSEKIKIDYWPLPSKIKALYMCADNECSVAVQRRLPDEPKLFALIHELKHHYCDRMALGSGVIHCGDYDANQVIEIGAEVFAAEFIYPEEEFSDDIQPLQLTAWDPENVVHFKRDCRAKVSYRFLCKRLERLRLISPGQFRGVQFQKLEYRIYGMPYRRQRRA
jgi:Zn-dependent peptidase ImmA (M78 family)